MNVCTFGILLLLVIVSLKAEATLLPECTSEKIDFIPNLTIPNLDTIADLKKVGNEILNEKDISQIDSLIISQLINCEKLEESDSRLFYIQVLNVICFKSQGERLEFVLWKLQSLSEKYPNEFLVLKDSELNYYAKEFGEIFATEEEFPQKRFKEYIENMRKTTDSQFQNKLNDFAKEGLRTIKERK